MNPGNSGGPLFNMAGEVIGINSQIFSRTGGFMGVSFAIPIDVARNVEEQLVKTGRVVRGRIGVTIQDVNAQLAESFGLDRPRGALVSSVDKDGPAAKAGVAAGRRDPRASAATRSSVTGSSPGQIATMKPGAERDAASVARRQAAERQRAHRGAQGAAAVGRRRAAPVPRSKASDRASALGLTVRPLEPQEKARAGTTGSLSSRRSPVLPQEAQVEPGDIVLGVNGKRVSSVKELQDAAKSSGKNVALLIQRQDAQIFLPLRLP